MAAQAKSLTTDMPLYDVDRHRVYILATMVVSLSEPTLLYRPTRPPDGDKAELECSSAD